MMMLSLQLAALAIAWAGPDEPPAAGPKVIAAGKVIDVGMAVDAVVFSPDGRRLALQGRTWEGEGRDVAITGHLLELRSARDGRVEATPTRADHLRDVAWLAHGKSLASLAKEPGSSSGPNAVGLIDPATGREQGLLVGASESVFWLAQLAVSPDDRLVAAVGPRFSERGEIIGGEVIVWDAATRRRLWKDTGATDQVDGVAFRRDGKVLATGGRDARIRLWDTDTGRCLRTIPAHGPEGVLRVAFSPDGKTLASGGLDGAVRLWDADTGREIRALTVKYTRKLFVHVAFLPDGKTLATGGFLADSRKPDVTLWDVTTGKALRDYPEVRENPTTLAVSPDGSMLAAGTWTKKLYLLPVPRPE